MTTVYFWVGFTVSVLGAICVLIKIITYVISQICNFFKLSYTIAEWVIKRNDLDAERKHFMWYVGHCQDLRNAIAEYIADENCCSDDRVVDAPRKFREKTDVEITSLKKELEDLQYHYAQVCNGNAALIETEKSLTRTIGNYKRTLDGICPQLNRYMEQEERYEDLISLAVEEFKEKCKDCDIPEHNSKSAYCNVCRIGKLLTEMENMIGTSPIDAIKNATEK